MRQACPAEIRTERLTLRRWREEDIIPYAALQADSEVRRYFVRRMTFSESEADARRHALGFDQHGFGMWVLAIPGREAFIGIAGVRVIPREMPFRPLVDVGWLLLPAFWGKGYATEAGLAALHDAFSRTDLPEVVAYTARPNRPSQQVMRRLGMSSDPTEDFAHPTVPADHPLRMHVLYRLTRRAFLAESPRESRASP